MLIANQILARLVLKNNDHFIEHFSVHSTLQSTLYVLSLLLTLSFIVGETGLRVVN